MLLSAFRSKICPQKFGDFDNNLATRNSTIGKSLQKECSNVFFAGTISASAKCSQLTKSSVFLLFLNADNMASAKSLPHSAILVPVIRRAMANAFFNFRQIITSNRSRDGCLKTTTADITDDVHDDVLDDFDSKISSWRTALYIAGLAANTDMEIVAKRRNNTGGRLADDNRTIGHL